MKKQSTCGVFFGRVKNEKERKKEKEKKTSSKEKSSLASPKKGLFLHSLSLETSALSLSLVAQRSPFFPFSPSSSSSPSFEMQSSAPNNGAASGRPRSPRSLEAGAAVVDAAAGGLVDVCLSVAIPPSPYRSTFSATGGPTKTVDFAQNSPCAAEGGVRIVFKVRERD